MPEPATGAEEAPRLRPREMLLQYPGMGDRLLDIDRVFGHRFTQRADERQRVDLAGVPSLGLGGVLRGHDPVVLAPPLHTPLGVLARADAGRLCGFDQEAQRGRDLAFEIVGLR